MESTHILDMLSINREYLRRRSDTAMSNLGMLHSSLDELQDESTIISLALNDAIAALTYRADYAEAIRISEAVIARFPESPHLCLIAMHELNISRCYTLSGDCHEAWEHLCMAEAIAFDMLEATDDTLTLRADVLHEVGMTTVYAGKDKDEAIRCFEKALRLLGHESHHRRRAVCIMAIGNVRFSEQRYEDAFNYYYRAETLLDGSDDYFNLSTVWSNLGVCQMSLGVYEAAETYLLRSLEMRQRHCSYGDIAGSCYNLSALYERRGHLEQAYRTMLSARDYAQLSQVRPLQARIIRELEVMSLSLGLMDVAEQHRTHLQHVERMPR